METTTQIEPSDDVRLPAPSRLKRRLILLAPLVPLIAIALVWRFSSLGSFDSPERVAEAARQLRASPFGFAYVLAAFSAGTLLFFPVTALIVGTTLAFDPLHGFFYAFAGALMGSAITYWVGRLLGSRALDYVSGPRVNKLGERLRRHAFRASIAARLLPVGNFTAINLLCGGLRIPFGAFMAGNVVGILPGVLILTFFADKIARVIRSPDKSNLTLLAVTATLLCVLAYALKRWTKQRERIAKTSEGSRP